MDVSLWVKRRTYDEAHAAGTAHAGDGRGPGGRVVRDPPVRLPSASRAEARDAADRESIQGIADQLAQERTESRDVTCRRGRRAGDPAGNALDLFHYDSLLLAVSDAAIKGRPDSPSCVTSG